MKLSLTKLDVKRARKRNIPALKHIWKTCFGDSEVDITSFFDNAFTEDTTLYATYDGEPAAMLSMLPCSINTPLRSYDGYYFYAIAVMPEYRGGGIMTEIEHSACNIAGFEEKSFVCLVPANELLFSAYGKLGYKVFSKIVRTEIIPSENQVDIKLKALDFEEFTNQRSKYLAKFRNSIRFTESYEKYAYSEYLRSKGKIYGILGSDGKYSDYICCFKSKGILEITETSLNTHDLQDMILGICEKTGAKQAFARTPGNKKRFAMFKSLADDGLLGLNMDPKLLSTNFFGFALE